MPKVAMNARISKLISPTYGWFSCTRSHIGMAMVLSIIQYIMKSMFHFNMWLNSNLTTWMDSKTHILSKNELITWLVRVNVVHHLLL